MAFCIPKEEAAKFRAALADGKIVPEKLADMSSAERRAFFEDIVGKDNAKDVNAMFESKLLLKDQKRGMVTWAKKVAGMNEQARQDIITRIEKLEKVLDPEELDTFLADLAEQKLGTAVTEAEAQAILKLTKEAEDLRSKVNDDSPRGADDRMAYGLKYVELQNYIRNLKGEDFNFIKDAKEVRGVGDAAALALKGGIEVSGTFKSLLSALDNSFFGRQGLPVLATNPSIWGKNFLKSWGDIGRELKRTKSDVDPMDLVKADIYSRPNAINGKYDAMKLEIGLKAEEAFPSALPGKVPGLGRLYKASETSFQAAALRMRADLADRFIKRAEEFGVDTTSKTDMAPLGRVTNSLTGRGGVGGLSEGWARGLNATFFSPRFLSANWDTLTGHSFGGTLRGRNAGARLARRIAAENVLKIAGFTASILMLAEALDPGSIELDPRSSKFGKIRVGKTYLDITGGKGPIGSLVGKILPWKHGDKGGFFGNGWGWWSKSATTGKWTDLSAGKYGQIDGTDVIANFFEGKLAPGPAIYRDLLTGRNFQGEKPTPGSILYGATIPLPIQSALQRKDVEDFSSPEGVAGLILEGLGLSASTYEKKK